MSTNTEPGGGRWVTVGFLVSLAVHALLVAALVSASANAGVARERAPTSPPESEDPLRFGLDTPARATINWLGIEDPTPTHVAPVVAESEQAALALDAAGGPTAPTQTPAPQPTPEPTPEPQTQPVATPPDAIEAPEGPEPVIPKPEPEVPEADEPVGPPVPDPVLELIERQPQQRPTQPAPAPAAGAGQTQGPGTGDAPGAPAQREADAIAKIKTLDVKDWTTPTVGQGIEIRPVRPRWPTHFRLGRLTKPALVQIIFGRDETGRGVVRRAEFVRVEHPDGRVEIRSSGDPEIDSIVLNAIYRWTASGADIDALGPGETMHVRVQLFTVR